MAASKSSVAGNHESENPLTAEEVARLKPIRSGAPVPVSSILRGQQSLLFSTPSGKRPKVATQTRRVAGPGKRTIWRVDVNVAGASPGARIHLRMKRVRPEVLRADVGYVATLHGNRPPWAAISFKPRP